MSFTSDWSMTREHWPELLAPFVGKPSQTFLEIGSFEGQSALWLCKNVLTGPGSGLYCIDPFDAYDDQQEVFRANTSGCRNLHVRVGRSQTVLPRFEEGLFDLVYVDGGHDPASVLHDAVNAHRITKPRGWILFDDYTWPDAPPGVDVKTAVDAFVECYAPGLERAEEVSGQFVVVKR